MFPHALFVALLFLFFQFCWKHIVAFSLKAFPQPRPCTPSLHPNKLFRHVSNSGLCTSRSEGPPYSKAQSTSTVVSTIANDISHRSLASSQPQNQMSSRSALPPPASAAVTYTTTHTTATATSSFVSHYHSAMSLPASSPPSALPSQTSKSATKSLSKSACLAEAVPAAQRAGTTFAKS